MGVRERYEQRQKEEKENGKTSQSSSVKDRYMAKNAESVASSITDRVNTWLKNHNTYISNYQKRYSGRKFNYQDAYVSDSGSWLDTVTKQKSNFDAEADSILAYMDQYKDYFEEDWMKSVRDTLTKARSDQDSVLKGATQDNEWWSSFGSEEMVKQYGSAEEAYKTGQRYDGYSKKYAGMNYQDAYRAKEALEDGEEKDWLSSYAESVITHKEARDLANASSTSDEDKLYYTNLANQKLIEGNAKVLAKTRMDGTSGSVLDEMKELAEMADGPEKDRRKAAVFSKMEELGISTKDYALYAGDSNFNWDSFWGWLGNNAASGLASFNKSISGTLGLLLGNPLEAMGWEDNPISSMADYYSTQYDIWKYGANLNAAKLGGQGWDIGGQLVEGTFAAVPNALLAIMSSGTSTAASGISTAGSLSTNAAYQSGNFLTKAGITAQQMAKNPQFWVSYAQTFSNDYEEAKAQGASDTAAAFGATMSSLINAGIEIGIDGGSGIQGLPNDIAQGGGSAIAKWAESALEEGGEEVLQGFVNNVVSKLMYNSDTELFDLKEMANEFAMGTAVGGILGGGQIGVQSAVNSAINGINTRKTNTNFKNTYGSSPEVVKALVKEGLESDKGSQSYQLAQKYQKMLEQGKTLTGAQIRSLVEANEAQFAVEDFDSAVATAEKKLKALGETENVNEVAKLVAKRATGQELTRDEKSTLARSQFGAKVANEMAGQVEATYKSLSERVGTKGRYGVSESGQATIRDTDEALDLSKAEVVKVGTGEVTVKLEDGREVYAGDIDFADDSQSYLYSGVSDIENITPAAANAIIKDIVDTTQPIGAQLNGIDEAYNYGFHGYSEADLKAGNFAPKLTKEQMMSAYKLGQSARKISVDVDESVRKKMRTAAQAKMTAKQKARIESDDVEVYFQDGKSITKFDEHGGKYDDKRRAAVNTAKFLSKLGIGSKYYFYESYVNKARERVYKDADGNEVEAPNGMYLEDGTIWIDLNAGNEGQGTALFTMGHELTHFIKAQSKKQFKVLGDLVEEAFSKTDMSMHERVVAKQDFLSKHRNRHVTYTEAYEEVVADAMSTMLTDGSFHEKIMEIKVKDKGLFNTIKKFFENLIAKFKKVYEGLTPDQKDAQDIREMKDMFDRIQTAFAEALVEASENFQAAMESVVDAKAEAVDATEIITEGAVVTNGEGERFSIRSMKHDIAEGKMFEDLKNVCGWTQTQVDTLKTQLKDLVEYMIPYRMILDMNETYGMDGRRFSPYKPNSDPLYKISMDFSTLCSKRLLTQYVIEQLQLRENRPMSAEEQMAIRDMLNEYRKVEKGLQVACSMCYVEAARLKAPKQIQRWLNNPAPLLTDYFGKKNKAFNDAVKKAQADFKESKGYDREAPKKDMKQADVKELNKIGPKMRSQYQPSAEEQAIIDRAKTLPNSTYLTAGNLADLSETDPVIYDAYTAFVRTATRSKSLEKDEPYYYGDSTRDNGNGIVVTDSFIEAVNRENGMRFSSWSDWRIQHLLDYITAVIDNSVRGAAMHGYTKFGDEVRVLGKTGMMFNMSGVTGTQTGLNEDGSLNFSETESIDVNEAIQLREEFPDTAGLQCIGVSDQHIIALLRSDIIDYVIPYHVSGLNADLRRMAKIYGWDDYTGTQNASIDKSIKFENAVDKEHWHEEPVFSEFFVGYDTGMTGIEAMRASAERYKQMCKDRGLIPKFNQFANEDNYWKLLIDRKMINQQTGNLIRQKAVTPTFDFDVIKSVVDKFVDNYDAGLEARALNHIVENWDSIPQRIKDLKKQGGTKEKQTKKSVDTLANQTVAAQPKDGVKNSDRKWKPNLDSTEWGIVKYTVDNNQGTAITSTCNMFFKKSKGRTLFGIYSTDDSTLLYASRESTAERERLFLEQFLEEYENGNVTDTSAEGLHTWAKAVRLQQDAGTGDDSGDVAPGRSAGDAALYGRPSRLYSSEALRNVLANIFQKETAGRIGDGIVRKSERVTQIASDFTSHMENIVKTNHGWYAKDVFKYVEEHPEFGFIELIYAKDKDVKKLLEKFLNGVDDVKVLDKLSWYMGEAYGDKDRTWNPYDGATYPYRGAVRTFRNAVKKRINAIMTEKVGGTNLGIKNGEVSLGEVKEMFTRLNSNEEIGQFAEKVFATAEKLGVNIRFVNQTISKQRVAGDNLGDMVEYKTSYFNDTTVTDQRKASTILHELIHACTVYVLDANKTMGDVSWNKSENYNRISNAATRLNRIYFEISYDTDFQGQYGIKNAKEMVAELANEEFVGLMKKKNLWDSIVDWICDLFGIRRGTSAYDNARLCVDYILDNPEVSEYKAHAAEQRRNASRNGYEVFGQTRFSERGDGTSNRDLLANAFEGITKSSIEYKLIQQYKTHIEELNELEAKLSDLNAEIYKIRFGTTGARDTARLTRLEIEAKEVAKAISDQDKKLLSLEASEPLRKLIEHERKKEAQKTKDHVNEIIQSKKVRAEQTELRHKIRKAVRDLDKLLNRGNKKLNVKEDVQGVVSKALKAADILFTENYGNYDMLRNGIGADLSDAEEALVNTCANMLKALDKMPTDGYENWQARQEAENRLKTKMSKLKDVFARERKRLNNTKVSSILGELADAYATLEKSEQSYVQGAYIEAVHNFLKNLQSEVGGTVVQDMTKDQLESVYAAYKMVLTTVRKANQLFNQELKMSREQLSNAVIQEVMKAGGTHGLWTKAEIAKSQFDWNNMKPVWVANRIGSDSFAKLMQGLFEGQYNFARDVEEAKRFKLEMDKKYHPRTWDAEKQYHFESSTGKEFSLNLQQIMSLYAFSKREQAYSHLLNGGFVFEGNSTVIVDEKGRKKTYIHNGATSYKLNEATLNEIINSLTAEQKAYVDEMQKYLSEVMGAKGNEVSMQLYGIKMFKEQFYFPLRSSGAYMERAKEAEMKKQQGQINLVNSGFTHSVKPEAKNPIILAGFMDVWAEHCNEMSMYHSMVLPMEDFRKVYNYSTIHDDKFDSASVFQTIQDAYGKAATDYLDQLYRELNAGATVDPRESLAKELTGRFKKAAVMLSASVVVQQFSSIGRAYAVIDPKYFTGAKVNSDTKLSVVEEMKKYAPVAIIKEMGGFDTGTKGSAKSYIMAEQYNKGERLQGIKTDEQYRSDLMGYLPAKADEKTWCTIWEAVKRETKATHPKMDVKSEEFLKLAGERFSEIIEKTQVYDSVLARSANMRSKGALMTMATAFMAEPTTTINLLEDAIRSGNKNQIARSFGAVAVSIVLNNALSSIVYAMRDDDEDETFIEKYFQSFTSGMIDDINPMSYYPFLKDVYSLFQGYDVERSDMSVIADVRDALKQAVIAIGKYDSEMNDEQLAEFYKSVGGSLLSVLDSGCSLFGVPFKNVRRDAMGIINAWNTVSTDLSGNRNTTWLSFWDKVGAAVKDTIPGYAWTKDKAKTDKLYEAIVSGDKAYLARLKSTYKTDSAYESAVRKALRENDSRIHDAAQAKYEGKTEEYKRIFKEIQKEGRFSFDDIMSAINSEESAIRNGVEPDKVTSQYSASSFVESIILGDSKTAQAMRDDIIATHIANGKTQEEAEEAFASAVSTGICDAYSSGLLDEAGAENMLRQYAGKDEEKAASKVSYWAFCEANPKYKDVFTESHVAKYHEFAEPEGISVDVFAQYINGTKGLSTKYDEWGEVKLSERDQVLAFIDSLPLTWQQKDALYLAHGYKESKIWDVPW